MSFRIDYIKFENTDSLTLQYVKTYLRVQHNADDVLIETMISASRKLLMDYLQVSVDDTSIKVEFDGDSLYLPFPYVKNIENVTSKETGELVDYTLDSSGKLSITKNYDGATIVEYTSIINEAGNEQVFTMFRLQIIARMYANRSLSVPINDIEGINKYKNITLW